MALWVILGLDLMSAHHRMEHKITKNFLSLILSSAWSPSPLGGNRWELLIKNFRGEREREREREENIYFWKLTKYFVSSFTWERSWLRGQMWEPSQIRYNLVILRMFEIQAPDYWTYILLAGPSSTPSLFHFQSNRFFISPRGYSPYLTLGSELLCYFTSQLTPLFSEGLISFSDKTLNNVIIDPIYNWSGATNRVIDKQTKPLQSGPSAVFPMDRCFGNAT